MEPSRLFARYQELARYVEWTEADARRVVAAGEHLRGAFRPIVEDFYAEIERHPEAARVITGGAAQIAQLKQTLDEWLKELFSGNYGEDFVARRWQVGKRHADVGLEPVYVHMALARVRQGLCRALGDAWREDSPPLFETALSLHKLLDLDLALIEDAYQAEHLARRQREERLIALGQMAGGIAHELRNPLNVVKTSVYYLMRAASVSAEKTREHLERIERQVTLADDVITALHDFARLPYPELAPVEIEPLLRDVLDECPWPESIRFEFAPAAELPPLKGDSRQLRMVFANLLRNAVEAQPAGGVVRISAAPRGGEIEVAVHDSGPGIAREHLHYVMEPLFSTKTRGLGLGLAICRGIVENHGGRIIVESEPGRGATFAVRLPAADS